MEDIYTDYTHMDCSIRFDNATARVNAEFISVKYLVLKRENAMDRIKNFFNKLSGSLLQRRFSFSQMQMHDPADLNNGVRHFLHAMPGSNHLFRGGAFKVRAGIRHHTVTGFG